MKLPEKILLTVIKDLEWQSQKNIIQLMVKEVSMDEIFNLQSKLPHYLNNQEGLIYALKEKLICSKNHIELQKHLNFLKEVHIFFSFKEVLDGLKEKQVYINEKTVATLQQFLDLNETGKIQFVIGAYETIIGDKKEYHYSKHPMFNYMQEVNLQYITEYNTDVEQLIDTFFKRHVNLEASEFTDLMRLMHKYVSWDVLFESSFIKRYVNVKAAFYLDKMEEKWKELQREITNSNTSKVLLYLMDEFEQLSHYFDGKNKISSLINDVYIMQQKAYVEKGLRGTLRRAIDSGYHPKHITILLEKVETLFERTVLNDGITKEKDLPQGKGKIKI